MRTLNDYIKVAVIRNNFRSKREFCKALGVSPNATTTYNNGTFPSDETMVKIAKLAGIDEATALLELAIWRTSGAAQKTYASILQKISQVTVSVILFGIFSVSPVDASTNKEHLYVNNSVMIHYHT